MLALYAMNTRAIRDKRHCYTRCACALYAINKLAIRDKRGDCSRLRQMSLRSQLLNFKLSSSWIQLELNLNSNWTLKMHYCRQTKQLLAKHQFIVIFQFVFYSYLIRICSYLFVKNTNEYERIRTEYELFTNHSNHLSTPNHSPTAKTPTYAKIRSLHTRTPSREAIELIWPNAQIPLFIKSGILAYQ